MPPTVVTLDWSAGESVVREEIERHETGSHANEPDCSYRIIGAVREDYLLMRLHGLARVWLDTLLGDFAFALLNGPEVRVTGDAGNALGDGSRVLVQYNDRQPVGGFEVVVDVRGSNVPVQGGSYSILNTGSNT